MRRLPSSGSERGEDPVGAGTYDKTNLPDELIVTRYFSLRDDKIVGLTIIVNEPSPY